MSTLCARTLAQSLCPRAVGEPAAAAGEHEFSSPLESAEGAALAVACAASARRSARAARTLTDAWGRPPIFRGDSPTVRSSQSATGRVLLGTSGGEVALLVPAAGELASICHSARRGAAWPGSLAALAAPLDRSLTASARAWPRLWSLTSHALLAMRPLRPPFSPDGRHLAVGLCDGGWLLLDGDSLKPVDSGLRQRQLSGLIIGTFERARRGAVGSLAFSPDGAMLAVGGTDGTIVFLAHVSGGWARGYNRIGSIAGHAGMVAQLDWSEEPVILSSASTSEQHPECWLLRSCAGATASNSSELFHWELLCERESHLAGASSALTAAAMEFGSGGLSADLGAAPSAPAAVSASASRVKHATAVRDVAWASETCSLTWGCMGASSSVGSARGLRAVSRSHEGEVLAASDPRGGLALWRWPACSPNAACKRYSGHAGPATRSHFAR